MLPPRAALREHDVSSLFAAGGSSSSESRAPEHCGLVMPRHRDDAGLRGKPMGVPAAGWDGAEVARMEGEVATEREGTSRR